MSETLKTNLTCLIADDYEIDRLTVVAYLRKYPFIQISGVYDNSQKALEHLQKKPVDILFLDIDMPGLSGLELRSRFMEIQVCIFITAYPDYAVDAFEAAALDLLIKPITGDRFAKTIQRTREYFDLRQKAGLFEHSLGQDTIFIKEGHEKTKVKLHDILYLEALRDYTTIVTPQRKYHVLTSLGNLLNESEFRSFIRIHRSFAVQRHYVRKLDTRNVYLDDVSLPLGKAYKTDIEKIFN
ncbi:MAG TPA: LytTR family DNA-binding domain-containing protein [Puia sp.]|jgi:DNA-binding LytR/AlgR family response regulator|nr:LytTR family DNA-binding domain-containing protein [Puia sp.]